MEVWSKGAGTPESNAGSYPSIFNEGPHMMAHLMLNMKAEINNNNL